MIRRIIGGAIAIGFFVLAWVLLVTGPKTEPGEKTRPPKSVTTTTIDPKNHQVAITAHGTVIPAEQVSLGPQVPGPIVKRHSSLVPGGKVKQGDVLFSIDTTLTKLDLLQAEASLSRAKTMLDEAKRQLSEAQELSDTRVIADTELASLEASHRIQMAEHQRLIANRDRISELLLRHDILAPFNAIVLEVFVAVGQQVSPGDRAATLVRTDAFWVQASVPVNQLQYIKIPQEGATGSKVDVFLDTGVGDSAIHQGEVVQLLGDMQESGRMARLLIEIKNPLEKKNNQSNIPMLIGSYVRVEIDAGILENVLAIDRNSLRAGDKIWVVDENNQLQIREAIIRWKKDETIYIDNTLLPGETLIISPLRVALPGMKVAPRSLSSLQQLSK